MNPVILIILAVLAFAFFKKGGTSSSGLIAGTNNAGAGTGTNARNPLSAISGVVTNATNTGRTASSLLNSGSSALSNLTASLRNLIGGSAAGGTIGAIGGGASRGSTATQTQSPTGGNTSQSGPVGSGANALDYQNIPDTNTPGGSGSGANAQDYQNIPNGSNTNVGYYDYSGSFTPDSAVSSTDIGTGSYGDSLSYGGG